jgi:hypothetical protein
MPNTHVAGEFVYLFTVYLDCLGVSHIFLQYIWDLHCSIIGLIVFDYGDHSSLSSNKSTIQGMN